MSFATLWPWQICQCVRRFICLHLFTLSWGMANRTCQFFATFPHTFANNSAPIIHLKPTGIQWFPSHVYGPRNCLLMLSKNHCILRSFRSAGRDLRVDLAGQLRCWDLHSVCSTDRGHRRLMVLRWVYPLPLSPFDIYPLVSCHPPSWPLQSSFPAFRVPLAFYSPCSQSLLLSYKQSLMAAWANKTRALTFNGSCQQPQVLICAFKWCPTSLSMALLRALTPHTALWLRSRGAPEPQLAFLIEQRRGA